MTGMTTPTLGPGHTREDLDRMPDDGNRYELLEGEIVMVPAPSFDHQRASGNLAARVAEGQRKVVPNRLAGDRLGVVERARQRPQQAYLVGRLGLHRGLEIGPQPRLELGRAHARIAVTM